MAYTTPRTYVAGEIHTAAHHNTYERDNIAWLATDAPCAKVYNSAAFTHNSSGNYVAATFNSETFDNGGLHSTSSNTSRITVPSGAAGKWLVGGSGYWDGNATGNRYIRILLDALFGQSTDVGDAANTGLGGQQVVAASNPSAADYFELYFYQNSGGNRTVSDGAGGSAGPSFWAFWFRT